MYIYIYTDKASQSWIGGLGGGVSISREKGKPPGQKGKREKGAASGFGLVPTRQWTPRVRTHERNETISR